MSADPTFEVTVDGSYAPTLEQLKAAGLPDDYTNDDLKQAVRDWWYENEAPARLYITVNRQVALQSETLPGVEPVTHKVSNFLLVNL